ncbi:MAG: SDR family NAD(P)-dependent oxidoreductase [Planctomycetota bacterium]
MSRGSAGTSRFGTALVTGASSGIGAGLAAELARRGVHVVACARRRDRLDQLASEVRGTGGRIDVFELDVRDVDAVRNRITEHDTAVGGFDLVIANAGVGRAAHAERLGFDEVRATLETNVVGACATLMAGLECMRPRGRGTLCGISSLASLGGMPTSGAYSASKAALATFIETLRIDLDRSEIEVIDVQPGFVSSEMTDGQPHPQPFKWSTERAVLRIVNDLERGRAISTFPWQLSTPLRLFARSPRWLWRWSMAALSPVRGKR